MVGSGIRPQAKTVLCIADVPQGHTISLVELLDGRLGICIDNDISNATLWAPGQIESCINAFLARKWELQQPRERFAMVAGNN